MSVPIEATALDGRVRVTTILVVLGIFAAGALFGAGVHRYAFPPHRRGGPLAELGLSEEQHRHAREIRERHRVELDAALLTAAPGLREIHRRMDEELAPFLTVEQRARLEALRARQLAGGEAAPSR
jgi:hypothetical protein